MQESVDGLGDLHRIHGEVFVPEEPESARGFAVQLSGSVDVLHHPLARLSCERLHGDQRGKSESSPLGVDDSARVPHEKYDGKVRDRGHEFLDGGERVADGLDDDLAVTLTH